MKKPLMVVALVLVVAAVSFWYLNRPVADEPLRLYGNVDIRELALAFRQGGRISRLLVDEGDRVSAGQFVAELDAEPFRNTLNAAEASVAEARAILARLEAGSRPLEIRQAVENERQATAVLEDRRQEYQRLKELAATGATSQQSLDRARYALDEASARVAAARATRKLLEEGPRQEDIDAARSRLQKAEAELAQARVALADTRLQSPADGTVLSRVVEAGAMVQAGSSVFSLALGKPVYVRAYVSEPNLGQVGPGTRVVVTTDSSGREYPGQVGFVSPQAEFTPKSVQTPGLRTELVYRLRILVQEPDEQLLQGMPVTVTLDKP